MEPYRHQILIASYRKDFPWLRYCLRSLAKFSRGFLPIVVAVEADDYHGACEIAAHATREFPMGGCIEVKTFNGPGFGRAQLAMMSGDILCPDADYYWLLGSDCLATRQFDPTAFCAPDGRPYMAYNSWEHLKKHAGPGVLAWKAGTEEAVGYSQAEFMRRLPLAYTRMVCTMTKAIITQRHKTSAASYVFDRVNRVQNFSESNVMGAVAYEHYRDSYFWVNRDVEPMPGPPNPIIQFWSHGGLDRPSDADGRLPREVIIETLGSL
jgi:hypothetical protein